MKKWYEAEEGYNDVVISSRIRLARNLAEYNFRDRLSDEAAEELVEKIRGLSSGIASKEGMEYYSCVVNKLNPIERNSLMERHTISPALKKKNQTTGLILSEDESVSIMINEEDHIRIQAMSYGQSMRSVYRLVNRIDDYIDSSVRYAYNEKYGYLTSCPTNVGTGMRASYMLSLPALAMTGKMEALSEEVGKFGIVIRGIYGEGTKGAGFIYQVSNQKTLGCSEQEIIENLDQVAGQMVVLERRGRETMLNSNREFLVDKIYRSYGVLKYAKMLTAKDAMLLLAQVKLGADAGILSVKGGGAGLYRLMMDIQPGNLQKLCKKTMGNSERDSERALYINKKLPELLKN